jgi:hypothetical protein
MYVSGGKISAVALGRLSFVGIGFGIVFPWE